MGRNCSRNRIVHRTGRSAACTLQAGSFFSAAADNGQMTRNTSYTPVLLRQSIRNDTVALPTRTFDRRRRVVFRPRPRAVQNESRNNTADLLGRLVTKQSMASTPSRHNKPTPPPTPPSACSPYRSVSEGASSEMFSPHSHSLRKGNPCK